jgi:4-amino-4-deoxy-L-arabinose transferase-like glycosyltransferase
MSRNLRVLLLVAAAVAVGRVLGYASVDTSIRAAGSEAADLYRVATNHQALRGYLPVTFAEQIAADFKPPLWYGGLALLFGPASTLSAAPFLVLNALFLAACAVGVFLLGRRVLADDRRAVAAAVIAMFVPGVAGRVTQIGVEPFHMALTPWLLLLLVEAIERPWRLREALGFGTLLGLGTLAKWNFGAYFVAPFAIVAVGALRRRRGAPMLLLGGLVALAWFGLWAVPAMDLGAIANAVAQEAVPSRTFYLRDLLLVSLGIGAWPLLGLRVSEGRRGLDRTGVLLLVTVVVVIGLHTLIPHKEGRYLLPFLPILAILLVPHLEGPKHRLVVGVIGILVGWSVVGPSVAERVGPPIADWTDRAVFLTPNTEPQASDIVLRHPALEGTETRRVGFLAGAEQESLRLTVVWELYARNDQPVIGLGPASAPSEVEPGIELVMDLLSSRDHDGAMREEGFVVAAESALDYPGEPFIRLWTR